MSEPHPILYEEVARAATRIAVQARGKNSRPRKALFYAIAIHIISALDIQYRALGYSRKNKIRKTWEAANESRAQT